MIICLSGFVIAGTSPAPLSVSRNDICASSLVRTEGAWLACAAPPAPPAEGGRFPPHQLQLLQRYPAAPAHRPPPPALLALRGVGRSSSSSAESVSSSSPPPAPPALTGYRPPVGRYTRVRTLYACLGESDGELSFEPNQIITNVAPSGEPGWLRGTLNGRAGLVPENYVEPLP